MPRSSGAGSAAVRAHARSGLYLSDGRWLAWREFGAPAGIPVIYCHGFPGCSAEAGILAQAAGHVGIRLIAPDRPGFGQSSPSNEARLSTWPADVDALLRHLGLERCRMLGMSGGGPYALACGAALGSRVEAIALLGALGPLDTPEARRGMSPMARASVYLARRHPCLQAALFHALAALLRRAPAVVLRLMLAGEAAADRAVLAEPALRDTLLGGMRGAVRQGARPAIAELRAYAARWPFTLADVSVDVVLWHGEDDPVVPPQHAHTMAGELPRASCRLLPGEAHFSLPIDWGGEIFRALGSVQPRPE
ncbi:MAG: alpha/beta hydrolase [Halofilum sp. (in: g-proteobacteria)]